jgi:hypothetical protein
VVGAVVVVVAVVVAHRLLEQPLVEVGRVVAGAPVVEVLAEQAQVVRVAGVEDAVVVGVPARHD